MYRAFTRIGLLATFDSPTCHEAMGHHIKGGIHKCKHSSGLCRWSPSYVSIASEHQFNKLMKYADDTYLMVASRFITSVQEEFDNISGWAESNNLKLNVSKTKELIVCRRRSTVDTDHIRPTIKGAERVPTMKVLGGVINSRQ